jgi:anhydro-N-acetylmuramic acid kinase
MYKYVIGLMSGTSLDGLDIVYVKFNLNNISSYEILAAETIPYSVETIRKLKDAFNYSGEQLAELDARYGIFLGKQILSFIQKNNIEKVDLIASHGQTVFHHPENAYTTQIGSGAHINAVTRIKTICDFRTQDVALGGQGAPLVPIGDELLFSQYEYCLNIGGFANVSFSENHTRKAFDICPANIVLNHYVNRLGYNYDDKGMIARKGNLHQQLLEELNRLPYYSGNRPKSLGWENVISDILPLIDRFQLDIPDILHTYIEHIAIQTGKKIMTGNTLVTGGGAYNTYLIERITHHTESKIIIPDNKTIDYKEALIFALLGLLRNENKINVLASVTGALFDHSSGIIYDAYNKNQN